MSEALNEAGETWDDDYGLDAPSPSVAETQQAKTAQHVANKWQAAWVSTQDISRDSESDLVQRIEAYAATRYAAGLQRAVEIADDFKRAADTREHYTNDDADRGASDVAEKIAESIRKEIK